MINKRVLSLLTACMLAVTSGAVQAECIKHQSVYGVIDADGQVLSVVDYVRLENRDRETVIEDKTELTGIENVRGGELFSLDGNRLVWQAEGKDIVYQGEGVRQPDFIPVISFHRDGHELTKEEAQKTEGPVTIRISYQMAHRMPMLCLHLILLPEGTEIKKAEHATTLVMGGLNLLLGWALPGLEQSLGIPETFEMTADLHGNMPEWILAFGTTSVLSDSVRQIGPYYEMTQTMDSDLRRVLAAWERGEQTPEVQNEKLKSILEELFPEPPVQDPGKAENREMQTGIDKTDSEKAGGDGQEASAPGMVTQGTETLETSAKEISELAGILSAQIQTLSEGIKALDNIREKLVSGASQISTGTGALSGHAGAWGQKTTDAQTSAQSVKTGAEKMEKSVKNLTAEANALSSGMTAAAESLLSISGGIEKQKKTADQIKSGTEALNSSINTLKSGAGTARSGAANLKTAANALQSGMSTLQASLQSLATQKNDLCTSADDMMKAILLSSERSLRLALRSLNIDVPDLTADGYALVLDELETAVNDELKKAYAFAKEKESLKAASENNREEILKATEDTVRMLVLDRVLAEEGMSFGADQYERRVKAGLITRKTQQRIKETVDRRMADAEILAAIEEQADAQIDQNIEAVIASNQTVDLMDVQMESTDLEEIRDLIHSVREQLDQAARLKAGVEDYTGASAAVAEQAKTLKGESAALNTNSGTLADQTAALSATVTNAESAASGLQSTSAAFSKDAATLSKQAKATHSDLNELAQNAGSMYTGFTALTSDAGALHTAAGTLLAGVEALKALRTDLEAGLKTITDASAALTTLTGSMQSSLSAQKEAASGAAGNAAILETKAASAYAAVTQPAQTEQEAEKREDSEPIPETGKETQKAAAVLLGEAQKDLVRLLNGYTMIKDLLGNESDYDPVPEGMSGDTVYIFRIIVQ